MNESSIALRADGPLPFKYVGGHPGLDLVNTVDWTSHGPDNERLGDYERLVRWARGAGVVSAAAGGQLRSLARSRPRSAERALQGAVTLRGVLQRLFVSVAAGERTDPAWREFAEILERVLPRLQLAPLPTGGKAKAAAAWRWREAETDPESVLWPVVRSVADLLSSDEAHRIRVCDGSDCGWMFVDRSRNRLRRWCEMDTCGTAAKSRRRRERSRANPAASEPGASA